jgi:hypothetical protein
MLTPDQTDLRDIYQEYSGIPSRIGKNSPQIESGNHKNHDSSLEMMMMQIMQ